MRLYLLNGLSSKIEEIIGRALTNLDKKNMSYANLSDNEIIILNSKYKDNLEYEQIKNFIGAESIDEVKNLEEKAIYELVSKINSKDTYETKISRIKELQEELNQIRLYEIEQTRLIRSLSQDKTDEINDEIKKEIVRTIRYINRDISE